VRSHCRIVFGERPSATASSRGVTSSGQLLTTLRISLGGLAPASQLSPRETEVFELLSQGLTNKEIARTLENSELRRALQQQRSTQNFADRTSLNSPLLEREFGGPALPA